MHQRLYSWRPIEYDAYKSLQYLFGRSAQEYSTILRIFTELASRNPTFKPKSYFDFGSGIGTGCWAAAQLWKRSIFEYYMVDASRHMNDLADLMLRDGDENRELKLRNVNFRQFLPASFDVSCLILLLSLLFLIKFKIPQLKYDIVLSAYSLLELPDVKTRLETLQTLWNKCDRYLIIVEQGTRAGFKLVNEARDFILYMAKEDAQIVAPVCHFILFVQKLNIYNATNFSAHMT